MKQIFGFFLAGLLLAGCASNEKNSTSTNTDSTNTQPSASHSDVQHAGTTTIEWIDPVVKELGKLKKDQEIEITYRFRNSGDKNLVIENVVAQCGCTIPEKPQQPFAPGEEGVIKAKFNGVGHGTISKDVTVTANTSPEKTHVLTFRGDIQ